MIEFPDKKEFVKRFEEENEKFYDYMIARIRSKGFGDVDALIMYCVLTRGLDAIQHILEKRGIPKEAIEELNQEMYEWKVETIERLKQLGK